MSDKYAAIARHRDRFPVQLMCEALGVSPSGFYAAQRRPRSPRARRDEHLQVAVRAMFRTTRGRYGSPRIRDAFAGAGEHVSGKRVARLMQAEALIARPRRRLIRTTDADHAEPVAPNLVARDFGVRDDRPLNHVWVGDITYIPTRTGTLYLAILVDLASRRVIGWALSTTLATTLPLAALRMALRTRRPAPGLICHSDRGSQYASHAYRAVLTAHGIRQSMSARGNCYDNAVAESFFATLEHELLAHGLFATHDIAQRELFDFIEVWYNHQRRHTSLGSLSPARYEALRFAA